MLVWYPGVSWKCTRIHSVGGGIKQLGISAVIQEKSDPAISYSDRGMNLQQRDQNMEDEPGSCWTLGDLHHRDCGGGAAEIIHHLSTWAHRRATGFSARVNEIVRGRAALESRCWKAGLTLSFVGS